MKDKIYNDDYKKKKYNFNVSCMYYFPLPFHGEKVTKSGSQMILYTDQWFYKKKSKLLFIIYLWEKKYF